MTEDQPHHPEAGRFPGKRVVAGCFVVLTTSAGLSFYGLAVYLNAFSKERGWSLASISLATTVFFIVGGFAGLWVARIIARRDVRLVMVGGGVIGAVALVLLGQVQQRWQLYAVYTFFAFGFTAVGLVPVTTVVTRWYVAKRTVALSVASTGLSVGGILITPVAKWLIDEYQLATATPILAVIWLVGTVPFALWLIRPDPAQSGWLPDGERRAVDHVNVAPAGVPYAAAVVSRFFRSVTIGYVLLLGAQVGGIQQLVKLVEERTSAQAATFATIALAAMSVLSRLAGGRVMTGLPMTKVTVVLGAVQAASLFALALSNTTITLFASILVFGATVGNILMLQPLLIAERFGVRDYPRLFSRSQFYSMFGTAAGPLLLGWLYDNAGGYRTSYIVAAACSLTGAVVLAGGGPARVEWDTPIEAPVPSPG
jgi:MFS family permease